ncbi:hypothetical protein G9U53_31330 [Rhodococcus sp. D-46]|jgi:hypothetical protein|uniref:Uncharacterized protein n=1 Tax=Rhodococcus erythropolis TaxID=1833 RepID=A0A6G9D402_RHOER|nr:MULTISPECIES: hypothetical protein [Rhodococcus]NHE68808.1 hypothetical protein [Rhodococcus sp. D-46]MBF7737755.1 hypothetical protein [Rhodococcus erythropolis]MBS2993546.1 hypothetical protein [Rhodococcus erythropolis]MCD2136358.1 hypothetical protein [Rhodococcus qingshengii]MCJ0901772.1 hypothetical protein [Rhodococcus sp. ARC_M13]
MGYAEIGGDPGYGRAVGIAVQRDAVELYWHGPVHWGHASDAVADIATETGVEE